MKLSRWQSDCLVALTFGDLVARDGQFCREEHADWTEQSPPLTGSRTVAELRKRGYVAEVGEPLKSGSPSRVTITPAGRRALRWQQEGARS